MPRLSHSRHHISGLGPSPSPATPNTARETSYIPADPLFSSQWHFAGNVSIDINITEAWDHYTGAGIRFGVYDDGIDNEHIDLAANYDASRHVWVGSAFDDPTIYNSGDAHGTAVAGLIAARQGNGQGVVGGSFNGTLTGVDIFGNAGDNYLFGVMNEQDRFDVTNHSWGWVGSFVDNRLDAGWAPFFAGLQDAAANGRGFLGTIQMVAAGNDRDAQENTNTSNFTSSRFVNAIAAIANDGQVSWYSTPGASLLIASPSNGGSLGITTTDYTGSVGYSSGNYTSDFGGTSAATPIASGVVGLILQANPDLGYRDVMEILAITARQIGSPDGAGAAAALRPWQYNGATNWNNGGMHFSHDYGFGLLDAFAAVKLAESWTLQQTFSNERMVQASNASAFSTPDNNPTGVSRGINLTPVSGTPLTIEAIEVQINWSTTHTYSGDLVIELISPNGTTSYLLDRAGGATDLDDWVFMTRAHLGELATGVWTVRVTDLAGGDVGTVSNVTLRAYGSSDVDDNYYYTDEFGMVGAAASARRTLTDGDGGSDTINAASLSSGATINLNAGATSTLAGSSFVIAAGTVIENAIGTWSNDVIHGNGAANTLRGNAGNDTINGNGGDDQITGGKGSDTVDGGDGTDTYFLSDLWSAVQWVVSGVTATLTFVDSLLGTDIVSNVEQFVDRLGIRKSFADLTGSSPVDSTAPVLSGLSPADGSKGVNTASNLVLTFSESVLAGTGTIDIRLASDGTVWRSLAVGSAEVTISGAEVTLDPGIDLPPGTALYVTIAAGVLTDLAGNAFAGIGDDTTFNFTTIGGNLIEGDDAANTLHGTLDDDIINGLAGNDTITGDAGDDVIDGGPGNDVLQGDGHAASGDTVSYASATGGVTVSLATTRAQDTRGAGTDILGGFENLIGSDFDDRLTGSNDGNQILGGDGNDTIQGNRGADTLWGDADADTFRFTAINHTGQTAGTADVIMDFELGTDRIDLSSIDASTILRGNNAFVFRGLSSDFGSSSDGEIRYEHDGTVTVIYGDIDRDNAVEFVIVLDGLHTLSASDFLL